MAVCNREHRYDQQFSNIPNDQGGRGRHKCAGCAYEQGLLSGRELEENIQMNLDSLDESQAGQVRHKSPHYAFSLGYLNGVSLFYGN